MKKFLVILAGAAVLLLLTGCEGIDWDGLSSAQRNMLTMTTFRSLGIL